jgi:hypothetical protein
VWDFDGGKIRFDCNFSSARLNGCKQVGEAEFKLAISPENEPINNSPWYAFKIAASETQVVTLDLVDTYSALRSRPWLSRDGKIGRERMKRNGQKARRRMRQLCA